MRYLLDEIYYRVKKWATFRNIRIAGIIAIAAIIALVILNNKLVKPRRGISLNNIITAEFTGYDTYGEGKITVDEDALKRALSMFPQANGHTYKFELSKNKDISNGERIWVRIFEDGKEITSEQVLEEIDSEEQVEVTDDMVIEIKESDMDADQGGMTVGGTTTQEDILLEETPEATSVAEEAQNAKTTKSQSEYVRFQDKSFLVKGLAACRTFTKEEVFAGLNVTFTGASPRMSLRVENKTEDQNLAFVTFEADKIDHIKNGDLITFTPVWDIDTGKRVGFRVPDMQLRYTVGEHNKYIRSVDALAQDQMRSVLLKAASSISSSLVRKDLTLNGNPIKFDAISNVKVKKVYFLRTRGDDVDRFSDTYNGMCMVFSFTGTVNEREGKDTYTTTYDNCYSYVMVTNLITERDGDLRESEMAVNASSLVANSLNVQTTKVFPSSGDLYDDVLLPFERVYVVTPVSFNIQEDISGVIQQPQTQQEVSIPENNAPQEPAQQENELQQTGENQQTNEEENVEEEEIVFSID